MTIEVEHPIYGVISMNRRIPVWRIPKPTNGVIKQVDMFSYSIVESSGKIEQTHYIDSGFAAPEVADKEEAHASPTVYEEEDEDFFDVDSARSRLEDYVHVTRGGESQLVKKEEVQPDNLVDIDTDHLSDMLDSTEELGEEFRKVLLDYGSSLQMAHDSAAAYTEAALNDGLGINASIGNEMVHGLNALAQSELFALAVSKSTHLPDLIKEKLLTQFAEACLSDALKQMKADALRKDTVRYKKELDNPVGQTSNSIGTVRRLSQTHG